MGSFVIGRFNQQYISIYNYITCFQVTLVQIINHNLQTNYHNQQAEMDPG